MASGGCGWSNARSSALLRKPKCHQAAILFVDLSGFTGLTESLGPAWTRDLLVELHERIERAATAHHGFVVSYMGDGAMIVFGLPAPQPLDAACALAAIEQLHRDLSAWLGNLPPVALGKLSPRVGGHFGPVVLSRLGTADHQHIAATPGHRERRKPAAGGLEAAQNPDRGERGPLPRRRPSRHCGGTWPRRGHRDRNSRAGASDVGPAGMHGRRTGVSH